MNYEKSVCYFKSSNGINDIAYYVYTPVNSEIKGIVQIVHGMCEYFKRYEHFVNFLCGQGYLVCGHDHLGHGASVNSREELGFFAEKNGWRCLVSDMLKLTEIVKAKYGDYPFYIIGHSMGSLVLRTALAKHSYRYDGAVIMDTISIDFGLDAVLALIETISAAKGSRTRSKLIDRMMFGMSNSRIDKPKTQYDWICTDDEVVSAYAEDPDCTFIFTVQAMYDLVMMVKYVSRKDWAGKVDANLPVLVLGGSEDPVGKYGKCPKGVFDSLTASGSNDAELKIYPAMRHEILNEKGKEEVYADIAEWLEHRLNERAE